MTDFFDRLQDNDAKGRKGGRKNWDFFGLKQKLNLTPPRSPHPAPLKRDDPLQEERVGVEYCLSMIPTCVLSQRQKEKKSSSANRFSLLSRESDRNGIS